MPTVNPNVLIWARESAGLSKEEAAQKLGLSGPDRLMALESGDRAPSRRQLINMSEKYHRPLLALYLPKPPRESDKGQDFRTLPKGKTREAEFLVDALLRDVQARQGLVRAALEEAEEGASLPFVGSARMSAGAVSLVDSMQNVLNFSAVGFRSQRTINDAFAALRSATESAGVFVLLMGNLGTYHTDIDPTVFRGFALADDVAPFIVINENDSRTAWSFTLLHELAHVFLGQTGISGYDGEGDLEKFCDAVAARFLLDPAELAEIEVAGLEKLEDLAKRVTSFARDRKLSRKMVAYNLMRFNFIGDDLYKSLAVTFDAERISQMEAGARPRSSADYYVVKRHRIGPGLVSVVKRMISGGVLTTTKASRVLGVKPTAVSRLVSTHRAA